jgi:hypothetical protein
MQSLDWRLTGLFRNEPGLFTLHGGIIPFETDEGVQLECPVGHTLNLTARGQTRLPTFARPTRTVATVRPVSPPIGVFNLGSVENGSGVARGIAQEARLAGATHGFLCAIRMRCGGDSVAVRLCRPGPLHN